MQITNDVFYVGVNDYKIDLFEGMYNVPKGVSYNSYVIMDEKIAVLDTVDEDFGAEWLRNVESVLGGKSPDYLIIHHMEPDHSSNALEFAKKYPSAKIVGNQKIFVMLSEYFGEEFAERRVMITDGAKLSLGRHELTFVFAPMVHWPEVMVSYDSTDRILFSADAFGTFGAIGEEYNWEEEARRYYYGIVGKYGKQVCAALKKLSVFDIQKICSLHGPVLSDNIDHYLGLYTKWANYEPERNGVMIAYASVYGHTKKAALKLKDKLIEKGLQNVKVYDIIRDDRSQCIADAFKYSALVLAATTYNADIFPAMREFIDGLVERNYQNRTLGLIENGTWAPVAAKLMQAKFEKCSGLTFASNAVKIKSSLNSESLAQLDALAEELTNKNLTE